MDVEDFPSVMFQNARSKLAQIPGEDNQLNAMRDHGVRQFGVRGDRVGLGCDVHAWHCGFSRKSKGWRTLVVAHDQPGLRRQLAALDRVYDGARARTISGCEETNSKWR